jgi:arylsulfatase A
MPKNAPNILFILADDMGYGDFGLFSEGRVKTPALDRLVSEGLCLTQHYSAAPVCAPARAGFLTGRYPHRTGAIDMREHRGLDRIALREKTVADHLQRAGYKTALIGKWHNGCFDPEFHPTNRGFHEFLGFRASHQRYYDWTLEKNGQRLEAKGGGGEYLTDVFTDAAINFIQANKQHPFFLTLAYNAPHDPLECPDDEVAPYRVEGRHENVAKIYGMVTRMDKGITRILDTLQSLGLANNTLVCFTSDNGPATYDNMNRFNCNFNGGKGHVYEGGIRVPMVLRWPDQLPKNHHNHALIHFCDWLPTLLAAATGTRDHNALKSQISNLNPDLPLDGINVLPALQGNANFLSPVRFWQWNRYQPTLASNAAMRDGPWKLVRPVLPEANTTSREEQLLDKKLLTLPDLTPAGPNAIDHSWLSKPFPPRTLPPAAPWELYNLDTDPGEHTNLAREHPEKVHTMAIQLENWFQSVEQDRTSITGMPK